MAAKLNFENFVKKFFSVTHVGHVYTIDVGFKHMH